MAIDVCRQKRESGQKLRNAGGFLVSFIKDEAVRRRLFSEDQENASLETRSPGPSHAVTPSDARDTPTLQPQRS